MCESKRNIETELNNGWILCPSKSFPGKFYYFNVLNGETAWSQGDNKGTKKGSSFHKIADKSHSYPEPTTLPDVSTNTAHNLMSNTNKPGFLQNISSTIQLPTFGQATFPKYVDPLNHSVVWTSVPFPMFCPDTKKPMSDKVTQISSFEREPFVQTTEIPLSARFRNYEEPKNPDITKSNKKPIISLSSEVEGTKCSAEVPKTVRKDPAIEKLDSSDLRFLLLAKRKSLSPTDTAVERKKTKASVIRPPVKKKVSFNLRDLDGDNTNNDTLEEYIPLTSNLSWMAIDASMSALILNDKIQPSFINDTYESPKTLSPNVKDQIPTFRPTATNQLVTYQPTSTGQLPSFKTIASNQLITFQPTSTNQLPTFKSTATNQLPTFQPTFTNQRPTFKSSATNQRPTFVPSATNQLPTLQQMDTNQLPTFQQCGTNQLPTFKQTNKLPFKNTIWYIVVDTDVLLLDNELIEKLVLADPKCRLVIPHVVASEIEALCLGDSCGQQRVLNARQLTRKLATQPAHCKIETRTTGDDNLVVTTDSILHCCMKAVTMNYYVVLITNDPHLQRRATFLNIPAYKVNDIKQGTDISPNKIRPEQKIIKIIHTANHNVKDMTKLANLKPTETKTAENIFKIDSKNDNQNFMGLKEQLSLSSVSETSEDSDKIVNITKQKCLNNAENITKSVEKIFKMDTKNLNPSSRNPKTQLYLRSFNTASLDSDKRVNVTKQKCMKKFENVSNSDLSLTSESSDISSIVSSLQHKEKKNLKQNTTKVSTGVFKIPKMLPMKNGSRNKEKSVVKDQIRKEVTIDAIDESRWCFRIKNKNMATKIILRIDEWLCCYRQILEDALDKVLQSNSVCMENTVAPLTLKDTLNCIKLLYDANTKVRGVINKLSELLEKCMTGVQGQFKMPVAPEIFMKIFGYGVLLVQELKKILPLNEDLKRAELALNALHINLQSNTKELDPDLVKTPSLSRSKVDNDQEEIGPSQLFKKTSYVLEYLKKHFKEWETYKEDLDEENHRVENHSEFRVVRTLGKNLKLLKIDKKKNMSLSNITEEDLPNKKIEPKVIQLLDNSQLLKPNSIENFEINETKLIRLSNNQNNQNNFNFFPDDNVTDQEKDIPLTKLAENVERHQNYESKEEEFNYTNHENTFAGENSEKDETKIIRNVKLIDEFENRFKTREPVDLELLDYEPSIVKNVDFDVFSDKNEKIENNNNYFDASNYEIDPTMFSLQDFYITPSVSPEPLPDFGLNNKNTIDSKITEKSNEIKKCNNSGIITSSYVNSVSQNNKITNSIEIIEKSNSYVESETYTEKQDSHNGASCIGSENSETRINNAKIYLDNSESNNEFFGKTAQFASTYAYFLVTLFLRDLCTTFKDVHKFVSKFADEICESELSDKKKNSLHNLARKGLEEMAAIIDHLKGIIKRESPEDTVLKKLLRNAGVEATADKRVMGYRHILVKSLKQAKILNNALKVIASITKGNFDKLSTNAGTIRANVRYFNITFLESESLSCWPSGSDLTSRAKGRGCKSGQVPM